LWPAGRYLALGVALATLGASSPALAHDVDDDSKEKTERDVRVYRWDGREVEEDKADGWQWNERNGEEGEDRGVERKANRFKFERADAKGGFLGVQVQSLTRSLMRARDLESDKGALVNRVEDEGPADEAGIRRGDVIVEVDRKPIDDASELTKVVRDMEPGDEATVVVIRDGRRKTIDVKLGKRPRDMMVFGPGGQRWQGEMPDMQELREHLKGMEGLRAMSPEDRAEFREQMDRLRAELQELREELRELSRELRDAREGGSRNR
jgi:membrane-associated protease RseP (regulator of RpoE activity)